MTNRERVLQAFQGKMTDYVPYHFDLTSKAARKLAEHYRIKASEVERFIGNHFLYIGYSTPEAYEREFIADNNYKDEFGIIRQCNRYEYGDVGVSECPICDLSINSYRFPDPYAKGRFRYADQSIHENPDCFNVFDSHGILELSCALAGIEDVFAGIAGDSLSVNTLFDKVTDFISGILEQLPPEIDAVRFLDDWGDQNGLTMGLRYWTIYIEPRLSELYSICKKKNKFIIAHSCGNITELIPDLIYLGVDVLNPLQPEVMDIHFVKKEYGRDISLFGGIGSQSVLPLGRPEDVIRKVEEAVAVLGEGGKYVLGPAGAVPTEVPVENLVAFVDLCRDWSS